MSHHTDTTFYIFPIALALSSKIRYNKTTFYANGKLHHPLPADIDEPLHDDVAEKIREYRADYNNCPSNSISFMSAVTNTSGSLHCELLRIISLQAHRETMIFYSFRS